MPHFFRYPLHVEPLLYMAMLSLATLLGFILRDRRRFIT